MSIEDKIKEQLEINKVVVYMKGDPDAPQCGFSKRAVEILKDCDAVYQGINVLDDPELRQGLKDFSNWPTFPQLYINGELIGGVDIMSELHKSGDLKARLDA